MVAQLRYTFIFLSCLLVVPVGAQQIPLFSQGFDVSPFLNPAHVDFLIIRQQKPVLKGRVADRSLLQLADGPTLSSFDADFYVKPNVPTSFVLGTHIVYFDTDPIFTTRVNVRLAVYQRLSNEAWLSVGLSPGLVQYRVNTNPLLYIFPDDPALFNENRDVKSFALGAGAYLHLPFNIGKNKSDFKYLFCGISMPKIGLKNRETVNNRIDQNNHYYSYLGLHFPWADRFFIEPLVQVKYLPGLPVHGEIVCRVKRELADLLIPQYWAGIGYSNTNMGYVEVGFGWPIGATFNIMMRSSYTRTFGPYARVFHSGLEFQLTVLYQMKQ
ncbi:MAG: type IX secretion system membrane protein PorP/SprF [Saprospiraceae bacterium]|nr:type IX secretion system membrane protein PorP/SprF [Saprospiraceae bacterium]MCB9306031.1 type IX secretion system membrane protein PorP/SprF [Lewinellaceae bacterium]